MGYDMFDYREMTGVLSTMFSPRMFLLETFFGGTEVKTHDTKHVDIDIVRRGRKMAAFVSPRREGRVVDREGYRTATFTPPYIKEKKVTTAEHVLTRRPGETIYAKPMTPDQRAGEILGEDMTELRDRILRREAWMAAQLLKTGVVVCQGDGIDVTIDFGMPSDHKIILSEVDKWTADTSDPSGNLVTWRELIARDSGLVPNVAVLGSDVAAAVRRNELLMKQLDSRRVTLGQIDPQQLPDGVIYLGQLEATDLYSFSDYYEDDDGDLQPMVPEDYIFLGSTQSANRRHAGLIEDLDLNAEAEVQYFAKSWKNPDPSARFVMVQSAPLPAMHQPDAFAAIKAV
ncbi:major capsid protein E [Solidesulfovibrio fructosivorans JJ]]|uniref:Major capsid protein E n=1 Tax=Solidesulfovibrio fructosivorans JJ] TaxID=596151 RepID=E1JR94_SOLFR|nr:major capsid protein [Solidesulfovibrio fructosivorans]EFL53095.1 major capsid protein E [Solidesulfovibrio fructosivorans JJ]]